jgi:hypothetical protein
MFFLMFKGKYLLMAGTPSMLLSIKELAQITAIVIAPITNLVIVYPACRLEYSCGWSIVTAFHAGRTECGFGETGNDSSTEGYRFSAVCK